MLTQILTVLAYQLPELLAASLVLALLRIHTRADTPGRKLAMAGTLLVLVTGVLRLGVGVGQTWMLTRVMATLQDSVATWLAIYSALMMLLSVVSAVGVGLLGWGAVKAMAGGGTRAA